MYQLVSLNQPTLKIVYQLVSLNQPILKIVYQLVSLNQPTLKNSVSTCQFKSTNFEKRKNNQSES